MISSVRHGLSMRTVAQKFQVSVSTVHYWVQRVGDKPFNQVDWNNRPHVAHHIRRTDRAIEDLVLMIRRELKEKSVLGEYGASAIHRQIERLDNAGEFY